MWKNTVERGRPRKTIWRMRIACWIPNAADTQTHTQNMQYLLRFHSNSICSKAPQSYVKHLGNVNYCSALILSLRHDQRCDTKCVLFRSVQFWYHCWQLHERYVGLPMVTTLLREERTRIV